MERSLSSIYAEMVSNLNRKLLLIFPLLGATLALAAGAFSARELTDITSASITPYWSRARSVASADFNQDGQIDFFAVHPGFENRLWLNTGVATPLRSRFLERTQEFFPAEKSSSSNSSSVVTGDFDEDGLPDLLISLSRLPESTAPHSPPWIATQPRLYLSSGSHFGMEANPSTALRGWKSATSADLQRIFGDALGVNPSPNTGALGASLTRTDRLALADLDGDHYPEIFVQAETGSARILWAPEFKGVVRNANGRIQITVPVNDPQFLDSTTQFTRAGWVRTDTRVFAPGSKVRVFTTQEPLRSQGIATISELIRDGRNRIIGVAFLSTGFPSALLDQEIRIRQLATWVPRAFIGTTEHRSAQSVVHVADLNHDGRDEILVAEGSRHEALSFESKCGVATQEACESGRLHIYGLDPVSRNFVDWMRVREDWGADTGVNDSSRESFQKGFATTRAILPLELNGDGVEDLVLLSGPRSNEERVRSMMSNRNIANHPPGAGASADWIKLHQEALQGESDVIPTESYRGTDGFGLSNSKPKILLSAPSGPLGGIRFLRADSATWESLLPDVLKRSGEITAAVRADQSLILSRAYSVQNDQEPFLVLPLTQEGSGFRIQPPRSCPSRNGSEGPTATLDPGLIVRDFNGDGISDLLNLSTGQSAIYWGNGEGCFHHDLRVPIDPRFINQLTKADFNGDGFLDLVGSIEADTSVDWIADHGRTLLYLNRGDGTFVDASERLRIENKNFAASRVTAFDANRDGKPDLLLFGSSRFKGHPQLSSHRVELLINQGNAQFERSPSCLPPHLRNADLLSNPTFDPTAADFNGDLAIDVVLTQRKGQADLLFNAMPKRGNEERCASNQADCSRGGIHRGLCQRMISAVEELGANEGSSSPFLTFDAAHSGNSNRLSTLAVGDLNLDGKPDVVLGAPGGAWPNPATVRPPFVGLFLNKLPPAFVSASRFPDGNWETWFPHAPRALPSSLVGQEGATCLAFGDFDGDSRVDLLAAGPGECSKKNNPADPDQCADLGHTLLPPWPRQTWGYTAWVKIIQNATRRSGATAYVPNLYEVDPRGTSSLSIDHQNYPGTATYGCSVGDFNGDGCPDLFFTGYGFGNTQSKSFGDTREQILVQKWYQQALPNRVYLNTCTRQAGRYEFERMKSVRNPIKSYSSVSGDFDGDGRDDIVNGTANQIHLYQAR